MTLSLILKILSSEGITKKTPSFRNSGKNLQGINVGFAFLNDGVSLNFFGIT
jgi:hypothetical protein